MGRRGSSPATATPKGASAPPAPTPPRRAAERAAHREEQKVLAGNWRDTTLGTVTFHEYVQRDWLPSKHIEATTLAAYVSNLDKHFYPFFGKKQMYQITASLVQDWVTTAATDGLSPRSIRKYHTMLHSIFKRAVRDKLIVTNPCEHTELPKIITKKTRTLTPAEYTQLITAIPDRYRLLVETAIETGMRWGELIALRPRHIDFLRKTVTGEETIIEVSTKHSPTGQRYTVKPYPKDNEARTFGIDDDWLNAAAHHITTHGIGRDQLLFTTSAGTPISRNTFRTRVWQPAVKASGLDFGVRMHDLRHAHASWLLA
jgi:integrase